MEDFGGGAFQYKEILFSVTCKDSIYIEKGPGFSIRRLIAMRSEENSLSNFFLM